MWWLLFLTTAANTTGSTEASLLSSSGCQRPILTTAEKVCCRVSLFCVANSNIFLCVPHCRLCSMNPRFQLMSFFTDALHMSLYALCSGSVLCLFVCLWHDDNGRITDTPYQQDQVWLWGGTPADGLCIDWACWLIHHQGTGAEWFRLLVQQSHFCGFLIGFSSMNYFVVTLWKCMFSFYNC